MGPINSITTSLSWVKIWSFPYIEKGTFRIFFISFLESHWSLLTIKGKSSKTITKFLWVLQSTVLKTRQNLLKKIQQDKKYWKGTFNSLYTLVNAAFKKSRSRKLHLISETVGFSSLSSHAWLPWVVLIQTTVSLIT